MELFGKCLTVILSSECHPAVYFLECFSSISFSGILFFSKNPIETHCLWSYLLQHKQKCAFTSVIYQLQSHKITEQFNWKAPLEIIWSNPVLLKEHLKQVALDFV